MSRYLPGLTLLLTTLAGSPLVAQDRRVSINRVALPAAQVATLETRWNTRIQDGSYWYDKQSGAWGLDGGPAVGVIPAGLDLGGPLPADASHGTTGVFVNGRELHVLDVAALMRIMPVYRGRWWLDGQGNFGAEGGPVMGNLWALSWQQAGKQPGAIYANGGRDMLGTDGNGCHYFNSHDAGTGSSTSWVSPGC